MPDDFKATKPALRGSVAHGGDIDWKDRSTQLSMWLSKDSRDTWRVMGKVGGDKEKSVVLYLVEDQDAEYKLAVVKNDGSDEGGW